MAEVPGMTSETPRQPIHFELVVEASAEVTSATPATESAIEKE